MTRSTRPSSALVRSRTRHFSDCPHAALIAAATLLLALAPALRAQEIPVPADLPYPGVIQLDVDATDLRQRIFHVHEILPVQPGPLVLFYPQWLPGNHSPTGPLPQLGGLSFKADGRTIEWRRDPVNVYAFHLEIPAGISHLAAEFEFLSPVEEREGRITATPDIVGVQWNTVVLYPAGHYARDIQVAAAVTLPDGFRFGTALDTASASGPTTRFQPVSLETLVDSPLFAGRNFRRIDLDPGGRVPVFLDLVADQPHNLDASEEQIKAHRTLVQQAYKLYGSHHYTHYDFLLALTEEFGRIGLEHHQSSENAQPANYFNEWTKTEPGHDLLSHEYTHSWDGKFRRPADLSTPNFNVPMQDSLLWVYEGQTQYWGKVLAARSGLMSLAMVRDDIATTAAVYDHRVGRSWRALQDTTNDPVINMRRPLGWVSWQRAEDYYSEGELVWLDVDTRIRELSGDKRSLNDFARAFFGVADGERGPRTYTFDEVVATLNQVQPFDWTGFLRSKLDGHGPGAPLDGLARGGWKLVYTEKPTDYFKGAEELRKVTDLSFSIGLVIDKDSKIAGVQWDGPAFKAGLTVGASLVALNGRSFKTDAFKTAITEAKTSKDPIELLIKTGERYTTVRIDYHEGLKYPRLERIEGTPDRLGAILRALP